MNEPIIHLENVTKQYGNPPVHACSGVSLSIDTGEFVAIVGPSGSGKSTLLNIIGTLDLPSTGTAKIAGYDINTISDEALSGLRAHEIGFVFQQFHLSGGVSAQNNVTEGLLYQGVSHNHRRTLAKEALERVGLGDRINHTPNQLSGGEQQRVAIARALISNPKILLADEPTGNLDTKAGARIIELLHVLKEQGTTILVITHNMALAQALPRQIHIRDGLIIKDSRADPQSLPTDLQPT